jgi:Cys-rich protein (TIGR01571 family)
MSEEHNPSVEKEKEETFEDEYAPVLAKKVIPFDGVEEATPEARDPDEVLRRVRVVAPCDLLPRYELLVKTQDGEVFDVMIPHNGAYRGQEFEAIKFQPKPIEGYFSDGLCDCCDEGNWCWIAFCCQGLAFGALMEKLKLTWCADRTVSRPKYTYAIVATIWFIFCFAYVILRALRVYASGNVTILALLGVINLIILIYFIVIQTKTRMAFRYKYSIPGECCCDCLASYFCGCCSALQMYRHMKHSDERPPVEAEIV